MAAVKKKPSKGASVTPKKRKKPEEPKTVECTITANEAMAPESAAATNLPLAPTPAAGGGLRAIVYCDGGARPNPGRGSWGLWGIDSNNITYNGWGYVGDHVTNNRAELYGYINVLKAIEQNGWIDVTVYFDSQYVLEGAKHRVKRWETNGWVTREGNKIPNLLQWQEVHALQTALFAKGIKIAYKWVKGHSGDPGNEMADANATRALLAGEKGVTEPTLTIDDGKKPTAKPKPADYNKLIAGRRLVFTTNTSMRTHDGRHIYLSANFDDAGNKQGKQFGTEAPDDLNAVTITQTPVEQFEAIIEQQNAVTPDDFVQPAIMLMDRVTKPNVWKNLTEHGKAHLHHERLNVVTVEGEPLTIYVRPPRRAYEGVDHLMTMFERLERYRAGESNPKDEHFDITDHLVKQGKKKDWKLHPDIKGSDKAITVPVPHGKRDVEVALTFNVDIPSRNNLSAVAKGANDMKVVLVKYSQDKSSFRYAVIVETDLDCAYYATSYANLKVF